jgi:small-conductance mechanosensitive channel
MTKPRTGQSGNWDRERADRLQKDVERMQKDIERLTTERDALAQIKRHIDEVRNGTGWTVQIYGVLLQQCDQYGKTIDTRRAERAEAERDALAAQVARVEEVLDHWRTVDEGNAAYAERIGERSRFADGLASRADMLRAALVGSEADTTDTQPTDQEVSDE